MFKHLKRGVEKNVHSGLSFVYAIRNMLFTYRGAPHHCLAWCTPAEMLHGRQAKCLLSLRLPSKITEQKPDVAISDKNSHFHLPKFLVGDLFFFCLEVSGCGGWK